MDFRYRFGHNIIFNWLPKRTKEANTQDTWNKIASKKQVVIGLDDSFVPMGFERKTAN